MKTLKLLDVWKKYDRCLVRENMRLKKIYNNLLKESEEFDECDFNEEDLDSQGEPSEPLNEDDGVIGRLSDYDYEIVPMSDLLENDDEENESDEDMISEEDFFEAVKDESDDEENEKTSNKSINDPELMSAEEFFSESNDEENESDKDTVPAGDTVSAEDFFNESDDEENESEDEENESEDEENESEDEENESDEEKKLEESLKSYRRKNHRLFSA